MHDPKQAPHELPPPSFRSKWFMLLGSAIVLLGLVIFERYERFNDIESRELARLQTLARATEANLLLHLKAIDRLLFNIRDRQISESAKRPDKAKNLPTTAELRFLVETTPGIRTLAIIDDKGNFLASSRPEFIGKNFAERAYFKSLQKLRNARTLVVSEPFLTSLNVWGVQLARPILGSNGEFLGGVMATLDPEFFRAMLSSALYADDLRCLLVHQDGVVFQAVGDFKAKLGTNLKQPGSLLTTHLEGGKDESLLIQSSYSTQDKRIAVLNNVGIEGMDRLFVVTFSRNFDQVFTPWMDETLLVGVGFFVLLFSGVVWLAMHQRQQLASHQSLQQLFQERAAAEAVLERHRQHLEELVDQRTQALAEAKERAETANRAKSLFLGNMSHEMRTPIHQISGMLGLLKNSTLTDKQKRYLSLQETAVNRLNAVIGSILTLVDLESGSKSVKLAPINPNQIVRDVVAMMSERATAKGLHIDFLESDLPEQLLGDASNIKTIAACYCDNAITFSERGNIRVRLKQIREEPGSILVRLEIQDEGIGIAPEDFERLFQHFEQADDSHTRKYGGAGTGLAIVRKLARLMGGDAGCESVAGLGSNFWASFVLVKATSAPGNTVEGHCDFVI